MSPDEKRQWMSQWKIAGPALDAVRVEELGHLDESRNARIAASFFSAENPLRHASETSGLVEQQAIFQRARGR